MKLTFLGSGSAFTTGDNFHSNMLLESENGKRLLIDCGSDARHSLAKIGLGFADIDAVYISHLHADHSGGLEWLAFTTKFAHGAAKPKLLIHETMVKPIWENQLKAGLQPLGEVAGSLATFFEVHALIKTFEWEGVRFELVPTKHIQDTTKWINTFGLSFQFNDKEYFITTDTQFYPDHFADHYDSAELIFHDCDTSAMPTEVHASYTQLKSLPAHLKRKMWLYHYSPGFLPDAVHDGFKGFVARGQVFDLK